MAAERIGQRAARELKGAVLQECRRLANILADTDATWGIIGDVIPDGLPAGKTLALYTDLRAKVDAQEALGRQVEAILTGRQVEVLGCEHDGD